MNFEKLMKKANAKLRYVLDRLNVIQKYKMNKRLKEMVKMLIEGDLHYRNWYNRAPKHITVNTKHNKDTGKYEVEVM